MVIVRIQGPGWETVIEVRDVFGKAAGVAARLRSEGLAAQQRRGEVLVNANAEFMPRG